MQYTHLKTTGITRSALLILISAFTAILITACGSGSSSTSGGGATSLGKASISGTVNSGVAFNQAVTPEAMLLTSIYAFAVPAAHAGAIYTVRLTGPGVDITTDTDASGNFSFQDLLPGAYSIEVMGAAAPPIDINLAADTNTKLELSLNGNLLESQVNSTPGTNNSASITGEVEDGNSSDNDQDSDDDQSVDDDNSEDDDDQNSEDNDDTSEDDDNSNDTESS